MVQVLYSMQRQPKVNIQGLDKPASDKEGRVISSANQSQMITASACLDAVCAGMWSFSGSPPSCGQFVCV